MKEVSRYISSLRVAPAAVVAAEEAKAEKGEEEQEESKSEEDKRKKEEAMQRAFENKVAECSCILRSVLNQAHGFVDMCVTRQCHEHKLTHQEMRA
jgi:hypothetical protein